MLVKQIMSTRVVKVDIDDNLATIKVIFDNVNFHHLLVVENGVLIGVISDRDLLKALSPNIGTAAETTRDLLALNKRAHQILSRDLVTVTSNTTVHDAIELFNQHKISCLPVVGKRNVPVGILSWRDVFRAIAEQRQRQLQNQDVDDDDVIEDEGEDET